MSEKREMVIAALHADMSATTPRLAEIAGCSQSYIRKLEKQGFISFERARPAVNSEADFWAKAEKSGDCLVWTGSIGTTGYGQVSFKGKYWRTHRLAFTIANGPIPDAEGAHGICVLHSCDNRLCIKPDHLSLGTQAENLADMISKGRAGWQAKEKNHAK